MRPSAEPWPCRSIVIILKESFARSLYNTKQQIDDEEIYERAINKLRRNLKADLNLCDSCVCWCRVPHREAMDKESFARSLYRDGSHEFLTSDLVVETLATDPKRGNIHLFACLVNHASVAWILSLTGCWQHRRRSCRSWLQWESRQCKFMMLLENRSLHVLA